MRFWEWWDERTARAEASGKSAETLEAFGRRIGVLRGSLSAIYDGGGATVKTARPIVRAAGGRISYQDLEPDEARQIACGRKPPKARSAA